MSKFLSTCHGYPIELHIDLYCRSFQEASLSAWNRERGWNSNGESSDGGRPVPPKSSAPNAWIGGVSFRPSTGASASSLGRPINQSSSNDPLSTNTPSAASTTGASTNVASLHEHPASQSGSLGKSKVFGQVDHEEVAYESPPPVKAASQLAALMARTSLSTMKNQEVERNEAWGISTSEASSKDQDHVDTLAPWKRISKRRKEVSNTIDLLISMTTTRRQYLHLGIFPRCDGQEKKRTSC